MAVTSLCQQGEATQQGGSPTFASHSWRIGPTPSITSSVKVPVSPKLYQALEMRNLSMTAEEQFRALYLSAWGSAHLCLSRKSSLRISSICDSDIQPGRRPGNRGSCRDSTLHQATELVLFRVSKKSPSASALPDAEIQVSGSLSHHHLDPVLSPDLRPWGSDGL